MVKAHRQGDLVDNIVGAENMKNTLKKVQVNMPFQMLMDGYLDIVIKEGINPEVSLNCFVLDSFRLNEFKAVAEALNSAGLSITLHAPFFDLRPGALDRLVREVTQKRLSQFFDLIPVFKPRSVVCHAAFDERYYVSQEDKWLENSIETWTRLIDKAAGMDTQIAIENVYEATPQYLGTMMDALDGAKNICFCFDTGHFNAFSESTLEEWMDIVGSRIGHIHLHDNLGSTDQHLPVGDGSFPFHRFFEFLKRTGANPVITLEPHKQEDLWRTLRNIKNMGLLD